MQQGKPIVYYLALCFCCTSSLSDNKKKTALIIVDVQHCFLPGGSLAVTGGDKVVPVINRVRSNSHFDLVILTQDWHCPNHVSFASQHPGKSSFDRITLTYDADGTLCQLSTDDDLANPVAAASSSTACKLGQVAHQVNQTLWPDHCVMNTPGARLTPELITTKSDRLIRKGSNCQVDSYSAFFDNGGFSQTQLNENLKIQNIEALYITGLATDVCVLYTALDAVKLGYDTFVIQDAVQGITPEGVASALVQMESAKIQIIHSDQLVTSSSSADNVVTTTMWTPKIVFLYFLLHKYIH